jgi:hypothetical protein
LYVAVLFCDSLQPSWASTPVVIRGRPIFCVPTHADRTLLCHTSNNMRRTAFLVLLLAAALGSASALKCKTYLLDTLVSPTAECTADDKTKMDSGTVVSCYQDMECGSEGTACYRTHQAASGIEVIMGGCSNSMTNCADLKAAGGGSIVGGDCAECTTVCRPPHTPPHNAENRSLQHLALSSPCLPPACVCSKLPFPIACNHPCVPSHPSSRTYRTCATAPLASVMLCGRSFCRASSPSRSPATRKARERPSEEERRKMHRMLLFPSTFHINTLPAGGQRGP